MQDMAPQGGGVLRSALEQVTHRIVIQRRLPPPFAAARIYVSSEGGLRYLRRGMTRVDPELLGLAAEMVGVGDTVWDIGANVGLFSFAAAVAAGPAGRVLAGGSRQHWYAVLLRRSAAVNSGHAPVEILPAAVSDQESVARFQIARRNRLTNYLDGFGSSQTGGMRTTELVPTLTLDWLAARFPAPDVIKIDVEQAEVAVLAGGSSVLGHASTIICEVAARNSTAVWDALDRHGYVLYDGDLPSGERVPVSAAPYRGLAVKPSRQVGSSNGKEVSRPDPESGNPHRRGTVPVRRLGAGRAQAVRAHQAAQGPGPGPAGQRPSRLACSQATYAPFWNPISTTFYTVIRYQKVPQPGAN